MRNTEFASVNIPVLDEQHKEIFELINALNKQFLKNEGWLGTYTVIERFQDLVALHFGVEENLMQIHRCPDLPMHIREHREFSVLLQELLSSSLKKPVSSIAVAFIYDWWINHIEDFDKRYANWFASQPAVAISSGQTGSFGCQDGAGI